MAYAGQTNARFAETRWSLIQQAAQTGNPSAQEALDDLFARYTYPIYAFLRRRGHSPHDAEDLTHGFVGHLLGRNWLAEVTPAAGRFRTFVLACLTHYVQNVKAAELGPQRNPGQPLLPINTVSQEEDYLREAADDRNPAELFERRWATGLIQHVLNELRCECAQEGKAAQFDALHPHLIGEAEYGDFAATARALNISEGAARVAAVRLRQRFSERFRAEVGSTVDDPLATDEEIRHMIALFSR